MIGSDMGFNLNDYQTVAERLDEALKEHGDMRVITSLEHTERLDGRPVQYVMKAELWLGTTLVSTGWAEEIVGNSPVNKTSALENCETSAVGRALANFGFQGKNPSATRPSRNEMEKVERVRRAEQEQVKQAKPLDWGEPTPPEPLDDPFGSWDALGALGAEVIEIKATPRSGSGTSNEQITDKQMGLVRKLFKEKHPDGDLGDYVNMTLNVDVSKLSEINKWDASKLIDSLKG
jgi:hypothetical protein